MAGLLFLFVACTTHEQNVEPKQLSIQQGNTRYIVELSKVSDSLNILSTRRQGDSVPFNEWKLRYPVYSLQTGDVDANGTDDIMVGVIKKTRYDKHIRKRLFVFKLIDGLIRPLWLGSRVGQPLCAFRFCKKNHQSTILTIENEKQKNKYLVAEYKWKSFGLGFIRYIKRQTAYENALALMNKE